MYESKNFMDKIDIVCGHLGTQSKLIAGKDKTKEINRVAVFSNVS